MKILQINRYHHIRGGSETVYFNTSNILSQKGHEVRFFAMDYEENFKTDDRKYFTPVVELPLMPLRKKITNFFNYFYNKNASRNLERLIIDFKPDVAHIHIFYGCLTSSILYKLKKLKIPIVITAHDYRLVCPAGNFFDGQNKICTKCQGNKYFNCFTNKCAKKSFTTSLFFSLEAYFRDFFYAPQSYINKFIFVSDFSLQMNVKFKPQIENKSVKIHNFLPTLNNRENETKKGSYFLYMGRLIHEKGVLSLVKAFNQRPDYKLKISGTGPLLNEILELKNSNIEYVGFNSGEHLKDLIINCSYVILPSEWYETFGMVILEAFSFGKPVLASSIGAIPEIIEDQENGFLFKPLCVESLVAALDNASNKSLSEYQELSTKAIRRSKKFESEHYYEELMKVYNSVIN
jgi:glycosyltransferase involved in cell wall biosynthesis